MNIPNESPRELVQRKLEAFLEANQDYFDAPYGVLVGMEATYRGGKVRTVTFGVRRGLDATARIYSVDRVVVTGRGGLLYKFEGKYASVEELIEHVKVECRLPQDEVAKAA